MSGFVSFLDLPPTPQAPQAPIAQPEQASNPPKAPAPEQSAPTVPRRQVFPLRSARDGHSLAEQAVYEALWNAGVPDPKGQDRRLARISYPALVEATHLSRVTVKSAVHALEKKLSIVTVTRANTLGSIYPSPTYRVYPADAIVQRRETAGFKWAKRVRGVQLSKYPI